MKILQIEVQHQIFLKFVYYYYLLQYILINSFRKILSSLIDFIYTLHHNHRHRNIEIQDNIQNVRTVTKRSEVVPEKQELWSCGTLRPHW